MNIRRLAGNNARLLAFGEGLQLTTLEEPASQAPASHSADQNQVLTIE